MTAPNDSGVPVREDASRATDPMSAGVVLEFFASVIKCGEAWSPTCAAAIADARQDLRSMSARLSAQAAEIAGLREALETIIALPADRSGEFTGRMAFVMAKTAATALARSTVETQ